MRWILMIPKELVRLIISEKVVPFIGAGFSRSFGYPGWIDLLEELKGIIGIENLDFNDMKNGDPLQIAQSFLCYYKDVNWDDCERKIIDGLGIGTHDNFTEPLKKIVTEETNKKLEMDFSKALLTLIKVNQNNINKADIKKLKKLGEINFNYILTTNYDRVIENEIMSGKNYLVQSLGKGEELNWNEKDKAIIKVHGDINSQNGIIFTHSQYYKFMHDFGYFRSKLYTLFSSNTILMMGYGFSDINIHQTYFQFIRDYGSQINNDKFYIVLTSYDKEKWGTYFKFYKMFLESYKINVIEAETLPIFVEDLSNAIKTELASSNLDLLFESHSSETRFPNTLLQLVNEGEAEYINNKELNLDFIRAFDKIFKSPFILNEKPFEKGIATLENNIAFPILDYTIKILENNPDIAKEEIYMEFVKKSLEYVDRTSDFWGKRYRIERFYKLSLYIERDDYDITTGKLMYEMFSACHPTKYLYSNPGGKFLLENIQQISSYYLCSYLNYIIDDVNDSYEEDEYYIPISQLHQYWIDEIKSKAVGKPAVLKALQEIDLLQKKINDFQELSKQ
ncbi:hypothetical protein COM90_22535 [Bacillus thuringiensis]|uniref:SIR2-like domain-containing protein n=2 Tax=Bacillus thuringiensis TaxID=1428 RepID=A0AB36TRZ0_BACTU|nr:hypothetical protein COM74_04315 [Bacillus thuringiensis]PEE86587.1 hypothetical protein COM90_22535 [Bacillus thuringiensis]PFM88078.1 hypothetical protein COJ61_22255 [Bacillus thuringiensis]